MASGTIANSFVFSGSLPRRCACIYAKMRASLCNVLCTFLTHSWSKKNSFKRVNAHFHIFYAAAKRFRTVPFLHFASALLDRFLFAIFRDDHDLVRYLCSVWKIHLRFKVGATLERWCFQWTWREKGIMFHHQNKQKAFLKLGQRLLVSEGCLFFEWSFAFAPILSN